MNKLTFIAGVAAAALMPSLAFAQQTCAQQRDTRMVGTVAGAGIGALLGSAVAGRDDRTTGAIVGGVGGAIIGNQLTKPNANCAYGYYDQNGLWHASNVNQANAQGYYARDGAWVQGAPNGYYDGSGRWVVADGNASDHGYRDSDGRWVPASASGYYDANDRWVAGAASGYYARDGRWVAGPANGRYDANGRWMAGEAAGRRDANGVWIADAQPGYYDAERRWRAGPAVGYYDARGRWIATAPAAERAGMNASYDTRSSSWAGAPRSIGERRTWLEQRVMRGRSTGTLSRREANRALQSLDEIRRQQNGLTRHGRLSARDEAMLQAKLDDVSESLRWNSRDERRSY